MEVFRCEKRFRILVAGRRFGKTELALVELLRAASGQGRLAWYVAPTYRQAKQIAWSRLKQMTRPFWVGRPNESELSMQLVGGGSIALKGADRYDSLRGNGLDFVVMDEYASMKPECWTEVLRPALSDRLGKALFIGTPQGADHFLDQFERAKQDPDWNAFQFTTLEGGNVRPEELTSAARELDERLFRQEFEASFEGAEQGRAYHAFSRPENVAACGFRESERLIWALDFNVDPMCSVLAQCVNETVYVLDEFILPDANTQAACEELHRRTGEWSRRATLSIDVYGDASGHQRRTSGSRTDWALIRDFFEAHKAEFAATIRAGTSNPPVRDRVNIMNSRLANAAGDRRLIVDPKCRELIRDFERVCWARDANGRVTSELDKSDRMRTHVSDALGYFVADRFAMRGKAGYRSDRKLVWS